MDSKSNSAPGPGRASPADERAMTPSPAVSPVALREELDTLFDELWPLPRSITGEGTRKTLELLGGRMGMQFDYVASGTPVFDWTTPPVWRVRAARLTGPDGAVVADFEQDNLSIINYAAPVDRELELEELQPHLHSIPQLPDATPYVTSYYQPRWGFCLPHARRLSLKPGRYHAFIDSDFEGEGGVPFAHVRLPGESEAEVMLTSYVCHPSLANNELSGPLTLLGIYRMLTAWPRRRFSYRLVLHPETIGALCYLSRHGDELRRKLVAGAVLTCLGGPKARLSYKFSRPGGTLLDELVSRSGARFEQRPFAPVSGADERQYGSPGFNLPVGQFSRTVYGEYDGYHNSLDTKAFMDIDQVARSVTDIVSVLRELELSAVYENLSPFGEPQLGKRDLYPSMNAAETRASSADAVIDGRTQLERILWVLNGSDGRTRMSEVAARAGCSVLDLAPAIEKLERAGLLIFSDGAHGPAPWRTP
jgi:aminopeptidase-like protein